MPIEVPCPRCRNVVTFADGAAGKRGLCPNCDTRLAVPRRPGAAAATRRRRLAGIGVAIGIVSLVILACVGAYWFRPSPTPVHAGNGSDEKNDKPDPTPPKPKPHVETFETAQKLELKPDGSATHAGRFETPDDVAVLRFVAPVRGQMTVSRRPVADSKADCRLSAYDAKTNPVPDTDSPEPTPGSIRFRVTAGETYYVKAAAFGPNAGAYELTFTTIKDDFGDTYETAHRVVLSSLGSAEQSGRIDFPGDVDVFRFQATVTGRLEIFMWTGRPPALKGTLTAVDGLTRKPVATDDSGLGLCLVNFEVVAGRDYFLKVAGARAASRDKADGATGEYHLMISTTAPKPVDPGPRRFDPATAIVIVLSPTGGASRIGNIRHKGDEDTYRFVATVTGTMTIRQDQYGQSELDSELFVYDDPRKLPIASNDDEVSSVLNSRVDIPVVAGRTYYIKAAASRTPTSDTVTTGAYRITISTASNRSSEGQEWESLLTYMPADTHMFMGVDVGAVVSHPVLWPALTKLSDEVVTGPQQIFGFDVRNVDYALFGFKLNLEIAKLEDWAALATTAVFRGKTDFDTMKMRTALRAGGPERRLGKTYYPITPIVPQGPRLLYLPTARLALVSSVPSDRIDSVLRSPSDPSALPAHVRTTLGRLGKPHCFIVPPPEVLRKFADEMGRLDAPKVVVDAFKEGRAGWVTGRLEAGEIRVEVALLFADAQTATARAAGLSIAWTLATVDAEKNLIATEAPQFRPLLREIVKSAVIAHDGPVVRATARFRIDTLVAAFPK